MRGGTILIAGRSGQLAHALPAALAAAGFTPVALGRPELDLADVDSIRAAVQRLRPALVVNAAAYTAVDRAEEEPWAAQAINAEGAGQLAAAARAQGAAFVHISTDYVFDGTKGAPYTEQDMPNPGGIYGASKLAGEHAVRNANPRSLVLRTSWVCSAHGKNFLRTMLRLAGQLDALRVVADQHGAPTFADDIAQAIATMAPRLIQARNGDEGFGTFHLSGAPGTSWYGFAQAILDGAAARGHRTPPLHAIATAEFPTLALRPADSRLDCSRIRAIHGIAQPDWRAGLARALNTLIGPRRITEAPGRRHALEGVPA